MIDRKDWFFLGWHVIKRNSWEYQWGILLWGHPYVPRTLDIWTGKHLWTIRKDYML